ncbi:MAG: hypothetical protein IJJ66_03850 [Treponema sp.]|nr:hypothetical protein [Treponema sp.]
MEPKGGSRNEVSSDPGKPDLPNGREPPEGKERGSGLFALQVYWQTLFSFCFDNSLSGNLFTIEKNRKALLIEGDCFIPYVCYWFNISYTVGFRHANNSHGKKAFKERPDN